MPASRLPHVLADLPVAPAVLELLAGRVELVSWDSPGPVEGIYTYGHPTVGDGRKGVTSSLWVFAPALGYARTFSRLYALGTPHDGAPADPR